MIKVTRENKNGLTSIRIAGVINEQVDLLAEIGALPPRVNIICREISQINSMGVKAWMDFFGRAARSGIQLTFSECPPPIVEQLNYITNFSCGGEVVSVSVPFNCGQCGQELRGTVKSEDLRSVSFHVPPITCPKCKSQAAFEDAPEEYFAFLIRPKRG